MKQKIKNIPHKPGQAYPTILEDAKRQKQEAEQLEVAGRHKNDSQKDYKGARLEIKVPLWR
jgi:hypothetical protein